MKAKHLQKFYKWVKNETVISFGNCIAWEISNYIVTKCLMYLVFHQDAVMFFYTEQQAAEFLETGKALVGYFQFPLDKVFVSKKISTFLHFITWPRGVDESDVVTVLTYLYTGKYFSRFSVS